MVEALYKIAPGFRQDKDEGWMSYLKAEERADLQSKRSIFLGINEKVEDMVKKTARLGDCPTEYEFNIETYVKKRNKLALKYANEIKVLKAKAEENKKRFLAEERESIKRPRLTSSNDDDDDRFEMEADDYMPTSYLPRTMDPGVGEGIEEERRQASFAESNLPPPPPKESYTLPENIIFGEADAYLRDVPQKDKQILSDLKPLILKYNCRDRVLKVIENLRAIDKRKDALNVFTTQVAKLRRN